MATAEVTVTLIERAVSWDERVARIRNVPTLHGTAEHKEIFAEVARRLYVPHLSPDFAYVPVDAFYDLPTFQAAYSAADRATEHFTRISVEHLALVLNEDPTILLPLRVLLGLTRQELAAATKLVAEPLDLKALSASKVDNMERKGSKPTPDQARIVAETIDRAMAQTLFGDPPGELRSKQDKPDTADGWESVHRYAVEGVPLAMFLHQRHYGGAFRQLLDATSTKRGDQIEDVVEALFVQHRIPYIRTGSQPARDRRPVRGAGPARAGLRRFRPRRPSAGHVGVQRGE
jgi:transcriptional regulator with XRE-family HTH domain